MRAFRLSLRDACQERWLNDRHLNALKNLGNADPDVMTFVGIAGIFDQQNEPRLPAE